MGVASPDKQFTVFTLKRACLTVFSCPQALEIGRSWAIALKLGRLRPARSGTESLETSRQFSVRGLAPVLIGCTDWENDVILVEVNACHAVSLQSHLRIFFGEEQGGKKLISSWGRTTPQNRSIVPET